jgi:NAD+ kinase
MTVPIRRAALLPNLNKQIPPSLILSIRDLFAEHGAALVAPTCAEPLLRGICRDIRLLPEPALYEDVQLLLVLGGDGSIIEAARRTVGRSIPIAGINLGRLGYLAEIEPEEIGLLGAVLRGEASIDERIMLDVLVRHADGSETSFTPALNDIVLTNGPVPRLLSFELWCDGELVEDCCADGMILAAPTGSTAYSLSAGGPVLDPCLDCICSTPICPQSMNNRPVIFRGDSVLELRCMQTRGDNVVHLSVDGRETLILGRGDIVRVSHSQYRTPLVRVKKGGFLSALRQKFQ